MNPDVENAVMSARKAAASLAAHPNSREHVKARTMALIALVKAFRDAGHEAPQTAAADSLGCDRQLIHRHVRRAIVRGWANSDEAGGYTPRPYPGPDSVLRNGTPPRRRASRRKPVGEQTMFSDVVDMETITTGAPAILPPFGTLGEQPVV